MKTFNVLAFVCAASASGTLPSIATPAFGAEYKIDKKHSTVTFRVKHLNVSTFYGRFNQVQGSITFDKADPKSLQLKVEVNVSSVDTNDEKRDQHIKGPDFFNVEQYKLITFKSTKAEPGDDNTYRVTGDLTLLGVTKPITVNLTHVGEGKDPWGGFRTGFDSSFTIKRSDFGMKHMVGGGLGDEIHIFVALEAIRQ